MTMRTESERLFEEACTSLGVAWERIPEEQNRTPDYKITPSGITVFAEVKQLEDNAEDKKTLEEFRAKGSCASFPASDERIRRAIKDANSQLKTRTSDEHPGILVLFAKTMIGDYDAQDLHDAMFGSETYTFQRQREHAGGAELIDVSLGRDAKMKPDRHTSTSAVISLRRNGTDDMSMTFYHNKFAKVPLNPDCLRAPSVRHYSSKDRPGMAIPGWVEI